MPLGSISLKHFVLLFRRFVFFPDLCCLFLTLIPSSRRINLREEIEAAKHWPVLALPSWPNSLPRQCWERMCKMGPVVLVTPLWERTLCPNILESHNWLLGANMIALFDSLAVSSKEWCPYYKAKTILGARSMSHSRKAVEPMTTGQSCILCSPVQKWRVLGRTPPPSPTINAIGFVSWLGMGVLPSMSL